MASGRLPILKLGFHLVTGVGVRCLVGRYFRVLAVMGILRTSRV